MGDIKASAEVHCPVGPQTRMCAVGPSILFVLSSLKFVHPGNIVSRLNYMTRRGSRGIDRDIPNINRA